MYPFTVAAFCLVMLALGAIAQEPFRPPSVPLIVSDPALSIWSGADHAYDVMPTHWSGAKTGLVILARVDKKSYQLVGIDTFSGLCNKKTLWLQPAKQLSLQVLPLSTIYKFAAGGVTITLDFTTTAIPYDLEVFSRGTTYITYTVTAADGHEHDVQLYFHSTGEVTINSDKTMVGWSRFSTDDGIHSMKIGSRDQNFFSEKGDVIRTSWGHLYVAFPAKQGVETTMSSFDSAQCAFVNGEEFPEDDVSGPRLVTDKFPVMAASWKLGIVGKKSAERHMVVFYDDIFSIQFYGLNLPPYWRHTYDNEPLKLATKALDDYKFLMKNISHYNAQLMKEFIAVGGWRFAAVTALSYRQVFGAMKLGWHPVRHEMWGFQKEMSTCGGINTIDVLYPSSPQLLYTNPELLRICLLPLMVVSNSEIPSAPYNLTWPTHCIGYWPVADMTPLDQEQLPLEVAADLILMLAAVAQRQNKNVAYLEKYKDLIIQWGNFIKSQLPFPPLQKCTDDFEGPSPNNTNLAMKGIISLEACGMLLDMMGYPEAAYDCRSETGRLSSSWMSSAVEGAGNFRHYRRQFDLPDTFSIKYNLVYQMFLDVSVFPKEVLDVELAYYGNMKSERYGTRMDDRHSFTLTEYQALLVALAPRRSSLREVFVNQLFLYANATEPRFPLNDYYYIDTARGQNVEAFVARPTIGALFAALMLL